MAFSSNGYNSGYAVPEKPDGRWMGAERKQKRKHMEPVDSLEIFMSSRRPVKVTILGHSHVTHILDLLRRRGFEHLANFGFLPTIADVTVLAEGGLKLKHNLSEEQRSKLPKKSLKLCDDLAGEIMKDDPEIVYIEMGTNDIDSAENSGNKTGRMIYSLATDLVSRGVSRVIAGEVLYRVGKAVKGKEYFDYEVSNCNQYLQVCLGAEQNQPNMIFWRHKNMWKSRINLYADDGIHFNDTGDIRLYHSIRGALNKYIRELRS